MRLKLTLALTLLLTAVSCRAEALNPLVEHRLVGIPERTSEGALRRSRAVIRAFRKQWACPETNEFSGACPGWAIDHVIPLACGGVDAVYNMQWLPTTLKSVAVIGKDRFERRIYKNPLSGEGCK